MGTPKNAGRVTNALLEEVRKDIKVNKVLKRLAVQAQRLKEVKEAKEAKKLEQERIKRIAARRRADILKECGVTPKNAGRVTNALLEEVRKDIKVNKVLKRLAVQAQRLKEAKEAEE